MLGDLMITHVLPSSPYMPNLGSLPHPHGIEEEPVVHRPGPGQYADVN